MKKHILCLGDSNTHGYCADFNDCADKELYRFNENERWTCVLQKLLGEDYLVIEEGLSGRTTVFEDPISEGMSALEYLYPCLKSHEPIDLLIVMLGTNDVKERIGANAYVIAQGMRRLLEKALSINCWTPHCKPQILLIAPPPIEEGMYESPVAEEMGKESVEKSRMLSAEYKRISELLGIHFLDAKELGCTFNKIDFMHLTNNSHRLLAENLWDWIRCTLK